MTITISAPTSWPPKPSAAVCRFEFLVEQEAEQASARGEETPATKADGTPPKRSIIFVQSAF